jgi:hypothetical protein
MSTHMSPGRDARRLPGAGPATAPALDAVDSSLAELLQPTIRTRRRGSAARPWRLWSQFWVAFLGGVLPMALIAYLNARRLGLERRRRLLVLAVGALGVVAILPVAYTPAGDVLPLELQQLQRGAHVVSRAVAVVLFLVFARLQEPRDRLYGVTGAGYDSLWRSPYALVIVLGAIPYIASLGLLAALLMPWPVLAPAKDAHEWRNQVGACRLHITTCASAVRSARWPR